MSSFGMCHIAITPLRAEDTSKSEMVSQLLFGELFQLMEISGDWWFIKCVHDDYLGWVDKKQVMLISDATFEKMSGIKLVFSNELVQLIYNHQLNRYIPVVFGSTIPYLAEKSFYVDEMKYTFEGEVSGNEKATSKNVLNAAQIYLNAPYLWGGRSPFGIDCSGLIQMVYKVNGIKLPRDAQQQAQVGETLNFISDAIPGDVAFFESNEGVVIHTGLIIGKNKIMHASGSVRIDVVDHYGIYNYEDNKYTHKLRLIKRYINE